MVSKCAICGGKIDALFPLLAEHPQHRICSACSIQKSAIVDAANRNDAPALEEAAQAFLARTCVSTSEEVKADMNIIIKRFEGMLLDAGSEDQDHPLNEFPATASDHIEGHKILKYCGTVGGNAVVLIAALRPGLEGSAHVAKLNNRRQMLNQARGLSANALVNCKVDYTTLNDTYLLITSTADAVEID